jgi:hypothetical protein
MLGRRLLGREETSSRFYRGVIVLAVLTLLAIGFVHSESRSATALAMAIFASATAASMTIIAA